MIQARCRAARGPRSRPACSPSALVSPPAAPRRPRRKSLTVGSKDFSGAQALSQAYGQALEDKGYDITLQGQHRRHRDRLRRARERRPRRRTPTTRARCSPTSAARRPATRPRPTRRCRPSSPAPTSSASKPAPAVDVNGFYVTQGHGEEVQAQDDVRPREGRRPSSPSAARPSARSVRSASVTTSQQLYGLEFSEVKKLDAGGPITVQALEDGDIDVALLFTGSSVIPKDAVLLTDDKGLQPADNPVFLIRKDKATPAALKIAQRGVGEAHHRGLQQDVARHQREQGRPGRRRGRLPEEERPRLITADVTRRVSRAYVFSRPAITLTVVAEDHRAEHERQQRVAQHLVAHRALGDVGVGHLERHAHGERGVREVEVVGALVGPWS